jgi:hypothetical protein
MQWIRSHDTCLSLCLSLFPFKLNYIIQYKTSNYPIRNSLTYAYVWRVLSFCIGDTIVILGQQLLETWWRKESTVANTRWRGDEECPGGRSDVRQNHPETDTRNEMLACPMAMVFVPVHTTRWFYFISCRVTPVITGSFAGPPCTEPSLCFLSSF